MTLLPSFTFKSHLLLALLRWPIGQKTDLVPLPQSLSEVQLIRDGLGLIYGPKPAPAIHFLSRRPDPNGPACRASSQTLAGSDGWTGGNERAAQVIIRAPQAA